MSFVLHLPDRGTLWNWLWIAVDWQNNVYFHIWGEKKARSIASFNSMPTSYYRAHCFVFLLFRIIYFMWWNIWTAVIWCFMSKWADALASIRRNSLALKLYRDWNFYIRRELFIGRYYDYTIQYSTTQYNTIQ